MQIACVLALGLDGRDRAQRRAAEERHLDVLRHAMEAEEPTPLPAEADHREAEPANDTRACHRWESVRGASTCPGHACP